MRSLQKVLQEESRKEGESYYGTAESISLTQNILKYVASC
jgi:hypothetical protein